MLTLTLAGCATSQVSEAVVLDALEPRMCDLAGAVLDDGGPQSRRAARNVIAVYVAGVDKPRITC